MKEFRERVDQRDALIKEPTLWFWTPAFAQTIDWLRGRVPPGGTVLEIGAGLGFVLHTIRNEGFEAVGLDVAELVVELNRRDGFRMWHGTVESVPPAWVTPDAIVAFFMLHHVQDPLEFLSAIRRQWPNAPLTIAQYGPTNRDPIRSGPPRTLTRWNAKSLATALELAGYSADVISIRSTGAERRFLRPARRLFRRTLRYPRVHRFHRRIERRLLPRFLVGAKQPDYVMLARAYPVTLTSDLGEAAAMP